MGGPIVEAPLILAPTAMLAEWTKRFSNYRRFPCRSPLRRNLPVLLIELKCSEGATSKGFSAETIGVKGNSGRLAFAR